MDSNRTRLEKSVENLKILNRLMRLSLSNEPLVGILEKALDIIHETSWLRILPKGGIFLYDPAKECLILTAQRNLSEEIVNACSLVPTGYCLCGLAARSKRIQYSGAVDHRHDVTYPGMENHGHYNVPILDEDLNVLGVLVLYLKEGHENNGSEIEFLSTIADTLASVIKRKQTESWNDHLAQIVEGAASEIYVIDAGNHKFLLANRSARLNLGYRLDELEEMSPSDLMPNFSRADLVKMLAPLVDGKQDHLCFETVHRRKDGTEYFANISVQILRSNNKATFAAIVEDITARKKAEKKLYSYRDELEELVMERTQLFEDKARELEQALAREKEINEHQRQFVSMASHEFRTPLAIIDSSAQRLVRTKNQLTPEGLQKRVDKIRSAVSRMTELMESTLAAAKMDSGKVNVSPVSDCDLRDVIVRCSTRFKDVSAAHNMIYDLKRLPKAIYGDQAILDQVFTNLLSNAVKYSPNGTDIIITGWSENDDAYVSIRDFGLGIDEEDLPRMFERFFRAKTSTGIAGTGIGLSLVKMFVEEHGGAISVESEKGKGSCFTVRLPCFKPSNSEIIDWEAA